MCTFWRQAGWGCGSGDCTAPPPCRPVPAVSVAGAALWAAPARAPHRSQSVACPASPALQLELGQPACRSRHYCPPCKSQPDTTGLTTWPHFPARTQHTPYPAAQTRCLAWLRPAAQLPFVTIKWSTASFLPDIVTKTKKKNKMGKLQGLLAKTGG